jgi:archaellum component FlaC
MCTAPNEESSSPDDGRLAADKLSAEKLAAERLNAERLTAARASAQALWDGAKEASAAGLCPKMAPLGGPAPPHGGANGAPDSSSLTGADAAALLRELEKLTESKQALDEAKGAVAESAIENAIGQAQWEHFGEEGRKQLVVHLSKLLRDESVPVSLYDLVRSLNVISVRPGWTAETFRSVCGWLGVTTGGKKLRQRVVEQLEAALRGHSRILDASRDALISDLLKQVQSAAIERNKSAALLGTAEMCIKNLATANYLLGGDLSKLRDDKKTHDADLKTLRDGKNALDGKLHTLDGEVKQMRNEKKVIDDQVNTLKEEVKTLQSDKKGLAGEVKTMRDEKQLIDGQVTTLNREMSTLTGEVSTLTGELNTLRSDRDSLIGRMETLTESKRRLERRVTELTEDADGMRLHLRTLNQTVQSLTNAAVARDAELKDVRAQLAHVLLQLEVERNANRGAQAQLQTALDAERESNQKTQASLQAFVEQSRLALELAARELAMILERSQRERAEIAALTEKTAAQAKEIAAQVKKIAVLEAVLAAKDRDHKLRVFELQLEADLELQVSRNEQKQKIAELQTTLARQQQQCLPTQFNSNAPATVPPSGAAAATHDSFTQPSTAAPVHADGDAADAAICLDASTRVSSCQTDDNAPSLVDSLSPPSAKTPVVYMSASNAAADAWHGHPRNAQQAAHEGLPAATPLPNGMANADTDGDRARRGDPVDSGIVETDGDFQLVSRPGN